MFFKSLALFFIFLNLAHAGATQIKPDQELYTEAVNLLSTARSIQKFPMDHSADEIYTRLTLVAHDLLRRFPDSAYAADTMFLLGLSYEVLRERGHWTLHEVYYEACIRKAPHTQTAEKCFDQYEQAIYGSYTGSSGVSVPIEELKKLDELEILATPNRTKMY